MKKGLRPTTNNELTFFFQGRNDDLMKKGLRLVLFLFPGLSARRNDDLMKKGLRLESAEQLLISPLA